MLGLIQMYCENVHNELQYYANERPGRPLKLGDIGILNGFIYTPKSNVKNLNLNVASIEDNYTGSEKFSSVGVEETVIYTNVRSDKGELSVDVKFSSSNQIFFQIENTKTIRIDDQIKLGQEIEALYDKDEWDSNWYVVTELVEAGYSIGVLSKNSKSDYNVKLSYNISDNLKINFGIESKKVISTNYETTETASNPLFKLSKLYTPLIGENHFDPAFKLSFESKKMKPYFGPAVR
ncbi:MAG: hypothetical protein B6D44_16320 [Ignavibacteriales bacterium UTCHB2]|nr:MAG: hypothetical protein B6D44_16320 [Ignavibacteriales bacterium UTCHB2]